MQSDANAIAGIAVLTKTSAFKGIDLLYYRWFNGPHNVPADIVTNPKASAFDCIDIIVITESNAG